MYQGELSVSLPNDLIRQLLTAYLQMEFPDPDLLAKVLPDYPPLAKRFVRDNGIWARTFTRENVDLITDGIAEITAKFWRAGRQRKPARRISASPSYQTPSRANRASSATAWFILCWMRS